MKFYFTFLLLCLVIAIKTEEETQCQVIYKYGAIEDASQCRTIQTDSTTKISTITCHSCQSGQYCIVNANQSAKCATNENDRIEGQSCAIGPNCISGTCENKKCKPKAEGESCVSSNGQCAKDHLCGDYKCVTLVKAGEHCENDYYCPIGYECFIAKDGTKTCKKMFSLAKGEYSTKKSLCQSGYITNENKCADTSPKEAKSECTQDSQCLMTIDDGVTSIASIGECVCSYEGKRYCALTSSSTEWKNYIDTFNKEINNVNVGDIHVAYQRGNENKIFSYWGIKAIRNSYSKFDVHYKNIEGDLLDAIFNDRDMTNNSKYLQVSFIVFSCLLFIIA